MNKCMNIKKPNNLPVQAERNLWCHDIKIMNDCKAFCSIKRVIVTQHVAIQHGWSGLQAVEEEAITLGPSGSILGCEHTVIVSQVNGVFHNGGASVTGRYLGEMLLWDEVWGGMRDRLIDRTHWVAPLNYCFWENICQQCVCTSRIWRAAWKSSRKSGCRVHRSVTLDSVLEKWKVRTDKKTSDQCIERLGHCNKQKCHFSIFSISFSDEFWLQLFWLCHLVAPFSSME